RGILAFRCRIGHAYSSDEVVIAKERVVEENLWLATTALAELTALLRDLVTTGKAGDHREVYEKRAARVDRKLQELRRLVEDDTPAAVGADSVPDESVP